MKELVIGYSVDGVWIYDDLDAPNYKNMADGTLYQLVKDDNEDMCQSIAEYISDTSLLDRTSCFLILRILRDGKKSFEQVHNFLDKKNIRNLPKEIVENDEYSLFGYQDTSDKTDEDVHGSFETDPPNEQIPINKRNSSLEYDKENSKEIYEDIPPPTEPKKSNSNKNKGRSRSSGVKEAAGLKTAQDNRNNRDRNFLDRTKPTSEKKEKPSSKISDEIVSSNDRKPIYVGRNKEVDDTEERHKNNRQATEIGNKGEKYILDRSTKYLLSKTNKFKKAPTNNKGYDIEEIDSNGEIIRYIEVKTLTGRWGEGGVAVTASQIEFAQYYDNWWLFVVENINTDNTKIHVFENPVQQANQFMFDHSWKQLSEAGKNYKPVPPQTGDKYLVL
jgi:hypothetical protein